MIVSRIYHQYISWLLIKRDQALEGNTIEIEYSHKAKSSSIFPVRLCDLNQGSLTAFRFAHTLFS